MENKEHVIAGRAFVQRPLVLGQLQQILELLPMLEVPARVSVPGVVYMLTKNGLLPRAMAIVLTEKGNKVQDKDLNALAEFMNEECDYLTTLEVVESFFEQNRPELVFKKVAELGQMIRDKIPGLTTSSPISPEETSQKEMPSSGNIPLENADPS